MDATTCKNKIIYVHENKKIVIFFLLIITQINLSMWKLKDAISKN